MYVLEKIKRGLERLETEGALTQQQAEARLAKWEPPNFN